MGLIVTVVIPFLIVVACAWIRLKPTANLRWLPAGALSVIIAGSVFGHDFFHLSTGPIPITIDRLLLLAMLALLGVLWLMGKEDLRKFNRVDVSILTLMAVISFSTVTHNWKILDNMPASRLLFFNLMPLAIYWVVRTSKLKSADLKLIAVALGMFGLYLALTAVAEAKDFSSFVFPKYIIDPEFQEFLGRGRGPFLNPVSNGIFMTTCFCCVLMWWPRTNRIGKTMLISVALVIAIGVYATLTRSVWVGFIVAGCGLFVWLPASRPAKGAMIVLATIITIVAFPLISEKIFSFKRDKNVTRAQMEKSAEMRPLFAIIAVNMFKDRPVMGCGFGQYAKAKYPYLQDPYSGKPLSITRGFMQHNVFLAYLTETGLIGLSCLLIMLFQMGRVSWKVWNNPSLDLWARQFGLLSLVILAAYSINGMFHDVSIIPMQHMLMFFVFGLANNIYSESWEFELANQEPDAQRGPVHASIPVQAGTPAGC
jgi:O-antigen ligase